MQLETFNQWKVNSRGKKFNHISQGFYRFRFLLHRYLFLIFFDKCLFTFSCTQNVYCTPSSQPRCWLGHTPKHNAFEQFWKFKFYFVHFPSNTQYLSFDGPSNYVYLFKNHRHTFPWQGERPLSHLRVIKMWFGPNIK